MRPNPAFLAAAAGLALACSPAVADSLPVRVAAITGQTPMQVAVGTVHAAFGVPVISANGNIVAYTGTVTGGGSATYSDEMVFRTNLTAAQTLPMARENSAVGGTNSEWFYDGGFAEVRVNANARVAFSADVRRSGSQTVAGRGVFSNDTQTYAFGLPEQQVLYGLSPAFIDTRFNTPAINSASTVAAAFTLTGPGAPQGQGSGLWTAPAGSTLTQLVARGTLTAPGTTGLEFAMLPESAPRLTDDGRIYFGAGLWGVGTGANAHGIWGGDPAAPQLIVRGGAITPLVSLGQPGLLAAASGEHVLFSATLNGLLTTPENDDTLWLWTAGTRRIIAQEGDNAPGVSGAQFDWFGYRSCVNASGHVAFPAGLRGMVVPGGNSGIWLDTGAGPQRIVMASDPAPGLPGISLGQIEAVSLNNADQVAFLTELAGPSVTPDNDRSLWVWTQGLGLTLVAREGDAIPLSTGGARTLELFTVTMGGTDDGQGTLLSENGRVAYHAHFTDDSRAILVATIPQPCYANCDLSTVAPILNVADFSCFLNHFAAGDSHANCDQSTTPPILNISDFSCFLNKFAAGCP